MYIYIYAYEYKCIYICVCVCVCLYVIHTHTHRHIYIYIHMRNCVIWYNEKVLHKSHTIHRMDVKIKAACGNSAAQNLGTNLTSK